MNIQQLKQEQQDKARQVIQHDDAEEHPLRLIGGADVGFEDSGKITRAVLVLMTFPELKLLEYQIARMPTTMPYIPGYLSFRECPALLQAWQQLSQKPDLLFVDGQGIAHPRGLGVASHFGLQVNCPTIGIAKKKLFGTHEPVGEQVGDIQSLFSPSRHIIGAVLRSKVRCHPLYISVGHKIGLETAVQRVQQCLRGYRLPEPTRWADAIASQRPTFLRWQTQQSAD